MSVRTIAILTLLLGACGASAQQKTLHATYIGVRAAEAGFVAWDGAHQQEIVAHAKSLSEGVAALHEYRLKRDPVLQAFIVVYQLLYVAAADTNAERVNGAIAAATTLYRLIELLKESPAGPMTTILDRPRRGILRVAQRPRPVTIAAWGTP